MSRNINRLSIARSVLFLCDIQEKFRPLIFRFPTVQNKCALMLQACNVMNVPKIVSEQYPKAFGPTVPEISQHFSTISATEDLVVYPKLKFSMLTNEGEEALNRWKPRNQAILCGIESHVCITQTALDLLERDYEVFIICDAVSSQKPYDRTIALRRLQEAGATLTTSESALFELMRGADFEKFKTISKLVIDSSALPELNQFQQDREL